MRPSVEAATSVFELHAHLVPAPVLAAQLDRDRMEATTGTVCADFGCKLIDFNGEANTSTRSSPSPDRGAVTAGQ